MDEYLHLQMINVHGNPEEIQEKINLFLDAGWVYVGDLTADYKPLMHTLGWPSDKGEPVYPKGYEKTT